MSWLSWPFCLLMPFDTNVRETGVPITYDALLVILLSGNFIGLIEVYTCRVCWEKDLKKWKREITKVQRDHTHQQGKLQVSVWTEHMRKTQQSLKPWDPEWETAPEAAHCLSVRQSLICILKLISPYSLSCQLCFPWLIVPLSVGQGKKNWFVF